MSKWDKPAKPVTEQFLQNEQRRRQMIIETSKRRRQKQKKLQQLNENIKKNEQEALQRMRKQKQEAYNKYLKNNNNNMHDKYEQIKRNQKMQIQDDGKREVSKWKKRDLSQGKVGDGELDRNSSKGEVDVGKNGSIQKVEVRKGEEAKKAVAQEFEKEWCEEKSISEDLIGSKLLDSLDLDIDTMQRGRQLTNKIQKSKNLTSTKPPINQTQVQQIKNLIGYDSMLLSQLQPNPRPTPPPIPNPTKSTKQKPKEQPQPKQVNEQQTLLNLKHKKQGKLFNWANDKVEEADDLFSNCSSNKNLTNKFSHVKDKESKGSRKMLQPIVERAAQNKSVEKEKKEEKRSVEKTVGQVQSTQVERKGNMIPKSTNNRSMQRFQNQNQNQTKKENKASEQKKIVKQEKRSQKIIRNPPLSNQNDNRNRSISKQKPRQTQQAIFQKQRDKSLQKIRQRRYSAQRTTSAQKPRQIPQPQPLPKTQQPFRQNLAKSPPIPLPKPTFTVATHEQYFDVQSFIKNDLLHLNQEQTKLQEEIRQIHVNNKEKVKGVEAKYQIRTNYGNSANLIKRQNQGEQGDDGAGYGYGNEYRNVSGMNQDLIQESIQRLDDLLIKKQIKVKEKTEISEQSQIKSIINPFSKPEDLHKQILQLAQNISKFQAEPNSDTKGYAYLRKAKKQPQKQPKKPQIPQQISLSKNLDQPQRRHPQPKKAQIKMPTPPILEYSSKNSQLVEINLEEEYYDPEDSLDTMKKEKIQVNQKLRNMLFD